MLSSTTSNPPNTSSPLQRHPLPPSKTAPPLASVGKRRSPRAPPPQRRYVQPNCPQPIPHLGKIRQLPASRPKTPPQIPGRLTTALQAELLSRRTPQRGY